jgi:hypothetical protein
MSDEHKQKPDPAKKMLSVLIDDDAKSLGKEYFEVGIDALVDSDIVDKLPIVNSVFAVGRLFGSVREILFARKVINFIHGLEGTQDQWRVFTEKIIEKNGSAEKAGEVLLEHLGSGPINFRSTFLVESGVSDW